MGKRRTPASFVLEILEEAGAVVNGVASKRHAKIKWTYMGVRRMTTVAQTPSDKRTVLNSKALVRRQLREIEEQKR